MKVSFFQFYPFTIWTPGGGETQLKKTKEALTAHGVETALFDIWSPNSDFDILHVFGSSYQLSDFVVAAKNLGKKVVVSAIAYSDKPALVWHSFKIAQNFLPFETVYSQRKRIYDKADFVISGSIAEAKQLEKYFSVPESKIRVVYNAADEDFANANPNLFRDKFGLDDFVLMVGRINNRKGQIRLIKALDGQNIRLVFVGSEDPSEPEYFKKFLRACETRSWIKYVGPINEWELLASAYASCRVHVLPSVGEFPGLVNLEAALGGARVVAGWSAPTSEHLGDNAFYCNPGNISSIRGAVLSAWSVPNSDVLRQRILTNFTWGKIAVDIKKIYEELL